MLLLLLLSSLVARANSFPKKNHFIFILFFFSYHPFLVSFLSFFDLSCPKRVGRYILEVYYACLACSGPNWETCLAGIWRLLLHTAGFRLHISACRRYSTLCLRAWLGLGWAGLCLGLGLLRLWCRYPPSLVACECVCLVSSTAHTS